MYDCVYTVTGSILVLPGVCVMSRIRTADFTVVGTRDQYHPASAMDGEDRGGGRACFKGGGEV